MGCKEPTSFRGMAGLEKLEIVNHAPAMDISSILKQYIDY